MSALGEPLPATRLIKNLVSHPRRDLNFEGTRRTNKHDLHHIILWFQRNSKSSLKHVASCTGMERDILAASRSLHAFVTRRPTVVVGKAPAVGPSRWPQPNSDIYSS